MGVQPSAVRFYERQGLIASERLANGYRVYDQSAVNALGFICRAKSLGFSLDQIREVLIGASEGGPSCIHFAARHPERLAGLILCGSLAKGSWAPDYPFVLTHEQYDAWLRRLIRDWGGPVGIATFAPSLAGDRQAEGWWAGLLRAASSPGAIKAVVEALRDTDVRPLLPLIGTQTLVLHRRGDRAVRIEAGRHLADNIPGARLEELDGDDHWLWAGDQQAVLEQIGVFVSRIETGRSAV